MKAALALIPIVFLLGCVFGTTDTSPGSPYQGRILDASTGAPIKDVVVIGIWYRIKPDVGGESREYLDAHETTTDAQGRFSIRGTYKIALIKRFEIMIFKAGYESIGPMGPINWISLKEGRTYRERIKWEGDTAIIPLRRLSKKERNERTIPSRPFIPEEKMKKLTKEINKERRYRHFDMFLEIE